MNLKLILKSNKPIITLIFTPHFLQYLRCRPGQAMDPAVLQRAGQLSGVGGGPPQNGGCPPGPSSIIGNDLKNFNFHIFLTSPFYLQLKLFKL
jgi:hypothetical protein